MHVIGEEIAERLDVIPAQYRVPRTRRPKYACRTCEAAVVQAPAPEHLIKAGLPTEAMVAHVLVSKYACHLPLYRQAQMLASQGIEIDRATLALWVGYAAPGCRKRRNRVPDWSEIRCRLPPKSPADFDRNQVPVCSDFCTEPRRAAASARRAGHAHHLREHAGQIGSLFEIDNLGPLPLAGFGEPQRAWRVVSESGLLSRFEALRADHYLPGGDPDAGVEIGGSDVEAS
jgi:transposase